MKVFLRVLGLATVFLFCSLSSQAGVIFSENFTGTTDQDISTLGWTQNTGVGVGNMVIADPEIRSGAGQWAVENLSTGGNTVSYRKGVGYAVAPDEFIELTVSTRAGHGAFGAWITLWTPENFGFTIGYANWGYGGKAWGQVSRPDTGLTRDYQYYRLDDSDVDLKMVSTSGVGTEMYYASESTGWQWTLMSVLNPSVYTTYGIWNVDRVEIYTYNEYTGTGASPGMDSIVVQAIPEPVSLLLLSLGGLALRRRS